MEIPSSSGKSKFFKNNKMLIGIAVFVASSVIFAATINRSTANRFKAADFLIAEVQQGDIVKSVSAPGTLQPDDFRWLTATSTAIVEKLHHQPGSIVNENTVILSLSNPELSQSFQATTSRLNVAEAELTAMIKRKASETLTLEATISEYTSKHQNANFRMKANARLAGMGVVSALDVEETRLLEKQFRERLLIEQKRKSNLLEVQQSELVAKKTEIVSIQDELALLESLIEQLDVKAGQRGVLQQLNVEVGQQVNVGALLAMVANQSSLKAELNVQESLVKEVRVGHSVTISAGGSETQGLVERIEPSVNNGTVLVEVSFEANALSGARPDLRVNAIINTGLIPDVLMLQKPVFSQNIESLDLYVLNEDETEAFLTNVRLGDSSTDKVEIVAGLVKGQKIIVSDTSMTMGAQSISMEY